MRIIGSILCALLVICYINPTKGKPTKGKTFAECINELDIRYDYGVSYLDFLGQTKTYDKVTCYRYGEYTEYFIDKLDRNESKTAYINTKSGFFVCRDEDQIPVVYDFHVDYAVFGRRYKTASKQNVITLDSCAGNRNNGYFTIKCEYPK